MIRLGFKQYLDTKITLLTVAESKECYPFTTNHCISKYCKIMNDHKDITFKPKQLIVVEWIYDKIKKRVNVNKLIFDNITINTTWNPTKLTEWVEKNTILDEKTSYEN